MDTDELTCAVCNEVYSSSDCKPVFLPCGHTFCHQCLQKIQGRGELKCPNCRKTHRNTIVEELPLNFSLLSLSENVQHCQELQICSNHSDNIRFWCVICSVSLCDICIVLGHRGDEHEIVKFNDYLTNRKEQAKKELQGIIESINTLQHSTAHNARKSISNVILSHKLCSDLMVLQGEVYSYKESIRNSTQTSLPSTHDETIKSFQKRTSKLLSCCERSVPNIENEMLQPEETKNEQFNTICKDMIKELPVNIDQFKAKSFSMSAFDKNGRHALLSWEDDKLHLCSFRNQNINSDIIIKWNKLSWMIPNKDPEVFLELSAKKQTLGKIYISLWGHLRRAQHFLALCLGSLGPTYSGMNLLEQRSWKKAEVLIGGLYANSHGHGIMKGLMENLEWGGESAGYCNTSHVVSFSKGNPEIDSAFAIVTNATEESFCKCPFGEVVSGLDVAIKASNYEPVSSVKISRCGVILPLQDH